jgi:hypothetical protein
MAQFHFNAREVEPDQGGIGAIPAGWYKTMVTKTELKATGDGTGQMIAAVIQVLEGTYKGSNFFTNFNVVNNSEKAVEIGRKQLSALCHAVNVLEMTETDQLKNIPFFTRVKLTPAVMDEQDPTKVKYQEKNETTGFRNINDQAAIAKAAETAQAAAKAVSGAAQPAAQARPAMPPQQPPMQQAAPQYMPPAQQAPQQQFQAPPMQQAPQQQFQAPQMQQPVQQPQFQAPQQMQQPVQQQQAPAGQPAWAAAPEQPWGAAAPAQQAQQQQQPQATPEQQAQYQQTMQAPPPWGAPQ